MNNLFFLISKFSSRAYHQACVRNRHRFIYRSKFGDARVLGTRKRVKRRAFMLRPRNFALNINQRHIFSLQINRRLLFRPMNKLTSDLATFHRETWSYMVMQDNALNINIRYGPFFILCFLSFTLSYLWSLVRLCEHYPKRKWLLCRFKINFLLGVLRGKLEHK